MFTEKDNEFRYVGEDLVGRKIAALCCILNIGARWTHSWFFLIHGELRENLWEKPYLLLRRVLQYDSKHVLLSKIQGCFAFHLQPDMQFRLQSFVGALRQIETG